MNPISTDPDLLDSQTRLRAVERFLERNVDRMDGGQKVFFLDDLIAHCSIEEQAQFRVKARLTEEDAQFLDEMQRPKSREEKSPEYQAMMSEIGDYLDEFFGQTDAG